MLRLDILMALGNINLINRFLFKNNRKNLKKLKRGKIETFIKWYLRCNYDESAYDKYAIYFYLDEAVRKIGPNKVLLLVEKSGFFESRPVEEIAYYFKILHNLDIPELKKVKSFRTYLTSKITKSYDLIELINNRVDIDYDCAFKSLLEIQNIHYLITYIKALIRLDNKKRFVQAIINSNMYSLDELKTIFLAVKFAPNIVMEFITNIYKSTYSQEDRGKIIDTFDSLIEATEHRVNFDTSSEGLEEGYKGYAYQISLAKDMPVNMKNDLAKKLIETKNYKFIYEWFLKDIKCSYNYDMIDCLILASEDVVANALVCINDKYVEYAVTKLLSRDKAFVFSVMEFIFIRVTDLDILRMDRILAMIYAIYDDFKLSKTAAINLIKHKSMYMPKYINEYEFNADEKERIEDIYEWVKLFLVIYESFIGKGNKTDLLLGAKGTEKVLMDLRLERRINN